jgi:small subunit ribosomal protein S4
MGFGSTRAEARQLVSHKALTVNGQVGQHRRLTKSRPATPSPCATSPRPSCASPMSLKLAQSIGLADWVQVDATKMEGVFKKVPDRDQYGAEIKEALIVELYSR